MKNIALMGLAFSSIVILASCRKNADAPEFQGHEDAQSSNAAPASSVTKVESYDDVLVPEPAVKEPAPAPTPSATPTVVPAAAFYPANCLTIKKAKPDALSGPYKIYLNAQLETRTAIDASCDMTTDGGGWTLILNYNHKAATTPPLSVRTNNLPILGSDILGDDESAKIVFWGHAGNALLNGFADLKELRFYCRSSQNTRVVHFKTSEPGCLTAARTGVGSCLNIKASFTALVGHTGTIPEIVDRSDANKLDSALTFNTFGKIVDAVPDTMWNIGGDAGLNVWECDYGSDNASFDTLHRVWFR